MRSPAQPDPLGHSRVRHVLEVLGSAPAEQLHRKLGMVRDSPEVQLVTDVADNLPASPTSRSGSRP